MDSYEKLSYIIKTSKTKHHLNAWEKEFIDSVQKQLKDTGNLTDRQEYCLDEIYRNSLLTERKMSEKIENRTKKIIKFVLHNYCQTCQNKKCNAQDVFVKYQTEELDERQINEINYFELKNIGCKNYIKPEEEVFGHIIRIHYMNGKTEQPDCLVALDGISKIWKNKNVEFVDIIWTDVF